MLDKQENSAFAGFIDLYSRFGGEKYMLDEDIVQRDHIAQAAHIARFSGAPEWLIIGLLLHDVGQVATEQLVGHADQLHGCHDELGARWLKERGFPSPVTRLVRYHTLAKVILCAEDVNYFANLSRASQISYDIQKKKFDQNSEVVESFRTDPNVEDFIAGRLCDDMAKQVTLASDVSTVVAPLLSYRGMFDRVRAGRGRDGTTGYRHRIRELYDLMVADSTRFIQVISES